MKQNIKLQIWVLIIGVGLLFAKFVAYWFTNSNAILTDALESIVNVVAGAFAVYSIVLASKPEDLNHPYGHGKIEFISATIEGVLIILAGVIIILKSSYNLFYPQIMGSLDVGIVITVFTGGINYYMGFLLENRGRKTRSMTLIADGKHLKSDAYSTLGLLIGLIAIYFLPYSWLDSGIAILFGGIIAFTGYKIVGESIAGIMDEADDVLLKTIISMLEKNRNDNWVDIHNLRVIKYGSKLHIDCHLSLPFYLTIADAQEEIIQIQQLVTEVCEGEVEIFIHIDACQPASCKICSKVVCLERKYTQIQHIDWNLPNLKNPHEHHLL
jgi:cation diffusion facilitator family transporter